MYYVRNARQGDVDNIYSLIIKSNILGIPKNKDKIADLVEKSIAAFTEPDGRKEVPKDYLFVLINSENKEIIGVSMIYGRFAFKTHPYHFFKVEHINNGLKKTCLKISRLEEDWTGIGGLYLSPEYHSHPEMPGQVIAWTRFLYMGMKPERFYNKILSILMSPYQKGGGNTFWDSVGKTHTGLNLHDFLASYKASGEKADGFINHVFSTDEICLDLKNGVGEPNMDRLEKRFGKNARRIIESQAFQYINSVHFDGGTMFQGLMNRIPIITNGRKIKIYSLSDKTSIYSPLKKVFIGFVPENNFFGGRFNAAFSEGKIYIPDNIMETFGVADGDECIACPDETGYIKM